ncbi:hypothetical protein SprV_0100234800 [Sparganum proliferum]
MTRVTDYRESLKYLWRPMRAKQDRIHAQTLIILTFSAVMMETYSKERPEIEINYRIDRELSNLRGLKGSKDGVLDLLFAVDCALNTATEGRKVEETSSQRQHKALQSANDEIERCDQRDDWFDDKAADVSDLLTEKNRLHKAYIDRPSVANKAAFYQCRRLALQRLREMQGVWMVLKAEELQGYTDHNEARNLFTATKTIYGPSTKGNSPLLSFDRSSLLMEKSHILKRWVELFRNVLNRSSTISDAATDRLPQVEINVDLDFPPSLQETIHAVQKLPVGKEPDSNTSPDEIYEYFGY